MLFKRKFKKIEDVMRGIDGAYQHQKGRINTLQEQYDCLERQCIEQAKDFENQLKAIKELIAELEKNIVENARPAKGKNEEQEVPLSQIMDEWLNGEKKENK